MRGYGPLLLLVSLVALVVVASAQAQTIGDGSVNEGVAVAAAGAELGQELDLLYPEAARVEPVTWANGCLGLAEAGELCTQALVDGFVIWFVADGTAFRTHTDGDGRRVRPAGETILAASVATAALPDGASLLGADARGGGLATAETDDDAPVWVWGAIGAVAAGTMVLGGAYGVWLRRRLA